MSKRWTPEQIESVESRGANLLVAAAAGSGKTSVLVERVIRRITDPRKPVDVDRLLVVTFTNAAAAEMRVRIARALAEKIGKGPGTEYLERQLVLLNRAQISTIHSFCLDVLRQNFYRIDLDPSFRIADEAEAELLRLSVLEELFERRYEAGSVTSFAALVECYGGNRDDAALADLVLEVYRFARSTPDPDGWLDKMSARFTFPDEVTIDGLPQAGALKAALVLELESLLAAHDIAADIARRPGGPVPYLETLKNDRAILEELRLLCGNQTWEAAGKGFNSVIFSKLKSCKKGEADERLVRQVRDLRDSAKKKVFDIRDQFFTRRPEELVADLRAVAPLARELAELVREFGEAYRKAKSQRGVVDFNDLEHMCLQVLTDPAPDGLKPSDAALELRKRFEEVLVDEYQDTNDVQEAIIRMVSRQDMQSPNLFMVGDVKQSIYRFRLAEPGLFMEKYKRYPAEEGAHERRIDLNQNFRSRKGLIAAVNFVFRQVMAGIVAEAPYDRSAELVYGADYPEYSESESTAMPDAVEFYLIGRDSSGEAGQYQVEEPEESGEPAGTEVDPEEELEAEQVEARLIARRIREMVEGKADGGTVLKVFDRESGTSRPAAYRDIVVLMRATSGYANTFVEEFRQAGVPVYAELSTGYFGATEVDTMLSLLKVIDNPRQDVPLAGVLRSPVVGLNAADLASIRVCNKKGDYYDAVVAAALSGGDLSDRLTVFLSQLEKWRTAARRGALSDLIWKIFRETGYYDFVGGLPGGGQRQANLRALYHRAGQYEATVFRGLFLFLRFIERLREGGGDLGAARSLGEKENVVRIMSIHRSKGLEFPVVFVAGLGRKFNLKDLNKTVLLHKELGMGPQFVDVEARVTYPTVAKLAIRHRLKMEALAEETRLIYVAMTRAREKLALVGSTRRLEERARHWCGSLGTTGWPLPDWKLAGAGSYLDWLVPAVARHREGAPIRELAGETGLPQDEVALDSSSWQVFVYNGHPSVDSKKRKEKDEFFERLRALEPIEPPGPFFHEVARRLSWRYPAAGQPGLAAKTSVTEIKRRFGKMAAQEDESYALTRTAAFERPRFIQEEQSLTAAEYGSALHLVMQHLDLRGDLDGEGIQKQVKRMVYKEFLTPEQAAVTPTERVAAFFAGSLGQRLLASRRVWRELPFTMALPAAEVYPEDFSPGRGRPGAERRSCDGAGSEPEKAATPESPADHMATVSAGDTAAGQAGDAEACAGRQADGPVPTGNAPGEVVLVQGVIDCLFEEGDGLVLLDYKTDRKESGQFEEIASRYRGQLDLYARAVNDILGLKVREKYLYLFSAGIEVRVV